MATDFALSDTHDKLILGNDYVLSSGAPEVAQSSKIRLLVLYREWTYDPSLGVPWIDKMFDPSVSDRDKKQIISRAILKTPGVARLHELQLGFDSENKGALVEFTAETIYTGEPITIRVTI